MYTCCNVTYLFISKSEVDEAKKNLSHELHQEHMTHKSKHARPSRSKKLLQARKEARLSKKNGNGLESTENSFLSLEDFPQNTSKSQDKACFGQLLHSLSAFSSIYFKKLNESVISGQAATSNRHITGNKWLKRLMEGSPFKLPNYSQTNNLQPSDSQNSDTAMNVQERIENGSQGSNESDFQFRTTNFLDEVFANDLHMYNSPNKVQTSKEEEIKCRSSSEVSDKSKNLQKSMSSIKNSMESSTIERTRGTDLNELTPKARKSSADLALTGIQSTLQTKTKLANPNDSTCIKELEAYKSKLRKALLEKELLENRMHEELEERNSENSLLRNQLSKLKSELRKCKRPIFYLN